MLRSFRRRQSNSNDAKSFVYVIKDDSTVESREIKLLATEGEVSAITEVSDGEMLVTDGFDRLQKGTKVTVKQPECQARRPVQLPRRMRSPNRSTLATNESVRAVYSKADRHNSPDDLRFYSRD